MENVTDIQKSTLNSLRVCCEKLGFEHFVDKNEDVGEYNRPNYVLGSEIIDLLNSLHSIEENLDVAEEDPSITVLKDCMRKIMVLDERRRAFEKNLNELDEKYVSVTENTSQLHHACDKMMSEQTQLAAAGERIKANLHYYKQYEWIMTKLQTSKLSLTGTVFTQVLSSIHDSMSYLSGKQHCEAAAYLIKYEQCMSKALTSIKQGVLSLLEACRTDVFERQRRTFAAHIEEDPTTLLYGVFGLRAASVKNTIGLAHQFFAAYPEYASMFMDCQQEYFQIRNQLLQPVICATLQQLTQMHKNSTCSLAKDGCLFLLKVCDDEFRLYKQFFVVFDAESTPASSRTSRRFTQNLNETQVFWSQVSGPFDQFIESLCRNLYDTLRPLVIHNHHLETLAQLCTLLKVEMIEERCLNIQGVRELESVINPRAGFVAVMRDLVGDVVERIVYRTEISTQNDLLSYCPASGDLLYPEMFLMMREIEAKQLKIQASGNNDDGVSNEHSSSTEQQLPNDSKGLSNQRPVGGTDIGLWYPTVKRAILWLSKLYKCLDPPIFTSVSRNVWDACCQSLENAAEKIREIPIDPQKATLRTQGRLLDARLFLVKHLLIMREQSTPFRVSTQPTTLRNRSDMLGNSLNNESAIAQFDYSLDLSKYRDSVGELLNSENWSRLFEFSSNNALLSFLLSPPVHVSELQLDSRRIIETQLKKHCQELIHYIVGFLTRHLTPAMTTISQIDEPSGESKTPDFSKHPILGPKSLNDAVSEAFKSIKQDWTSVRGAYTLYIANAETEEILLQPVRKGLVEVFTTINLFVHKYFNPEQLQIASVPNQEQIWLLIS